MQLRFPVIFSGGESRRKRGPPMVPLQARASRFSSPLVWITNDLFSSPRAHRRRSIQSPHTLPPTHLPRPSGPRATPTSPSRRGDPARSSHRHRAGSRSRSVSLSATCVPVVSQRSRNKILIIIITLYLPWNLVGGVFILVFVTRIWFSTPSHRVNYVLTSRSSRARRNRRCRRIRPRSRMKLATTRDRTRAPHGAHR